MESSTHLFQRPLYSDPAGAWHDDFDQALQGCGGAVHLDVAAIASVLSFGMVGEERTLLREVKRRPWMSEIQKSGEILKAVPPPHGVMTGSDKAIAIKLYQLLSNEARKVCEGFSEVYVLLSGGLDSRIIAGVLADLYHAGEILAKPIAITWGLRNSRDVAYAKQIAKTLGFEWKNIEFGPETVLENIDATARQLGLLHSPEMLHNMLWFKNISQTSLVIAGSFGDSVGRAEFAGLHLLQLNSKKPSNAYNLLKTGVFHDVCLDLKHDLDAIHSRIQHGSPSYVRNEHWMQGFRMRGGLCHALSIINSHASLYQMFTAPEVYGFMWSLHPSRRDDEIYAALLEHKLPQLARIPWPRTNRALRGVTNGAQSNLLPNYHEYTKWSSGPLYAELSRMVDPDWFEATGIFEPESIRKMNETVRISQERVGRLNDIWLWLAGFRAFSDFVEGSEKKLIISSDWSENFPIGVHGGSYLKKIGIFSASKSKALNSMLKSVRNRKRQVELSRLKRKALQRMPPVEFKDL